MTFRVRNCSSGAAVLGANLALIFNGTAHNATELGGVIYNATLPALLVGPTHAGVPLAAGRHRRETRVDHRPAGL